ncbi:putative legumain protein [Helianthus debilis subsp. tardiflorus]
MMSCGVMSFLLLLLLMPVMVSNTCVSEALPENNTRWELLEAVAADQIHIEDGLMIRTKESYHYYFWNLIQKFILLTFLVLSTEVYPDHKGLKLLNKMRESLKEVAFRDRRLDMVGLILFGPDKGLSFLCIRHDMRPEPVNVLGYIQCVRTLDGLFEKHCGPYYFRGLRHTRSRANLCSLVTKEAIEEAMILACGMNFIEPG